MHTENSPLAKAMTAEFVNALDIDPSFNELVSFIGEGSIPGYFAYTDFLAASMAAVGVAISQLMEASTGVRPAVRVSRDLNHWCMKLCQPVWPQGKIEDVARIGAVYATADGRWLRLTDATPSLQQRILAVLGTPADTAAVAAEVKKHNADDLEAAVLAGGGAASASRSMVEWAAHPAGQALSKEPVVAVEKLGRTTSNWRPTPGRPLAGIRVLDFTRIVAGPMATRILAAYGAEVLRIDPPWYEDHGNRDQTIYTIGKRCARLDLTQADGRERFLDLLADADMFVHGYRPGIFENLGLPPGVRDQAKPDIVEVIHNAYGWTGPWANRRGFDTIVTVSLGMLNESMKRAGLDFPDHDHPGLSQHSILDHCLGHIDAAAAIRGLTRRLVDGIGSRSRLSLARGALILGKSQPQGGPIIGTAPTDGPFENRLVMSTRGPARQRVAPIEITGNPLFWDKGPELFGSSTPTLSLARAH
ncbi:MAG TPA: CoA transferase [Devosia sp.]|nr:CoA transferase [Devosia sp.]